MFMCVVNLKAVNKLDLTWKQSFLIICRNGNCPGGRHHSTKANSNTTTNYYDRETYLLNQGCENPRNSTNLRQQNP